MHRHREKLTLQSVLGDELVQCCTLPSWQQELLAITHTSITTTHTTQCPSSISDSASSPATHTRCPLLSSRAFLAGSIATRARTHGMNDDALQSVFRSVVVARLLYAASAWHALTQASDQRRIDALFHRARRQGYCPPDLPAFQELCDSADDELLGKAVRLSNRILHDLLPPPSTASQHYELRHRTHSLQLPEHSTHLSDCNFFYTHVI